MTLVALLRNKVYLCIMKNYYYLYTDKAGNIRETNNLKGISDDHRLTTTNGEPIVVDKAGCFGSISNTGFNVLDVTRHAELQFDVPDHETYETGKRSVSWQDTAKYKAKHPSDKFCRIKKNKGMYSYEVVSAKVEPLYRESEDRKANPHLLLSREAFIKEVMGTGLFFHLDGHRGYAEKLISMIIQAEDMKLDDRLIRILEDEYFYTIQEFIDDFGITRYQKYNQRLILEINGKDS